MKIAKHGRINYYLYMHAVDISFYYKRSFIKSDNLIHGWSLIIEENVFHKCLH